MLYDNLGINEENHLTIGGADTVELARQFGTALYVIDENKLRSNVRTYVDAMNRYFVPGSAPLLASKALCFKGIYPVIDDEGMSISNPGGFIDGVNLKNLLTVEPHGRNPALADAMKRIGLAEKTGRGIDRIYEGSIIFGRPWPDYTESTSRTVKLFIQRAKANLPFAKLIADEQKRQQKTLSIYTLMILSLLNGERRCSLDRIIEVTNLSENKVRAAVENMIEIGLIEASGNGKNRSFILGKKVYREANESIKYVRQTDIDSIRRSELIMKLAETQQGIITKQDVMDLFKISPAQAYSLLKQLKNENKITLLNGGKYARYRIVE